jgi:lipopolysaccharide transport system permease protein
MKQLSQNAPGAIPVIRIVPPAGLFNLNLSEFWRARELAYFFVWRDIKVRYKQTAIGATWAVLQPVMNMLVFTLFFGRLAKIPSNGASYPVFFYSALLPWTYFATAMTNATNVVVEQQGVITKIYFPRLILPFSAVVSPLADFAIGFILILIMMAYYHLQPTSTMLLLPLFLGLAILTALGVGLWLSALNAIYRDVRYVVPFLVQFWMFASPVAYPSSLVPAQWRWVYGINPMAGVIEGFRWAITGSGDPPSVILAASVSAVLILVVSGGIYFKKVEGIVADVV